MTDTKLENPPAFPLPLGSADLPEPGNGYTGITIRDYFAAAALQGLIIKHGNHSPTLISAAYKHADAMLTERAKA